MKKIKVLILLIVSLKLTNIVAQEANNTIVKSDLEQITEILMDYIEGTANGQP